MSSMFPREGLPTDTRSAHPRYHRLRDGGAGASWPPVRGDQRALLGPGALRAEVDRIRNLPRSRRPTLPAEPPDPPAPPVVAVVLEVLVPVPVEAWVLVVLPVAPTDPSAIPEVTPCGGGSDPTVVSEVAGCTRTPGACAAGSCRGHGARHGRAARSGAASRAAYRDVGAVVIETPTRLVGHDLENLEDTVVGAGRTGG